MTTYHVDAENGADGNPGTSAGAAWSSVARVNREDLRPGDTVLFRRGQTFDDDRLVITEQGQAGRPITFGAYGEGAAPVFDGGRDLSDAAWRDLGGGVWATDVPRRDGVDPRVIHIDGATHGREASKVADLRADGDWTYENGTLSIRAAGDPSLVFESIVVPSRNAMIDLPNAGHVRLEGLAVVNSHDGIHAWGTHRSAFVDLDVGHNGQMGLWFARGAADNVVEGGRYHHNGGQGINGDGVNRGSGIELTDGARAIRVDGVDNHGNAEHGVQADRGTVSLTVENSRLGHNGESGLAVKSGDVTLRASEIVNDTGELWAVSTLYDAKTVTLENNRISQTAGTDRGALSVEAGRIVSRGNVYLSPDAPSVWLWRAAADGSTFTNDLFLDPTAGGRWQHQFYVSAGRNHLIQDSALVSRRGGEVLTTQHGTGATIQVVNTDFSSAGARLIGDYAGGVWGQDNRFDNDAYPGDARNAGDRFGAAVDLKPDTIVARWSGGVPATPSTGAPVRPTGGADALTAGGGNDTVLGLGGDDVLKGGAGRDRLEGGDGADTLHGGPGDDADTLRGDAGDDTLHGGGGNDVLVGGSGEDRLFGGSGDDVYLYARGDGVDHVHEEAGDDVLRLQGLKPADVTAVARVGLDLVLEVAGGRVVVHDHFKGAATALERVEFVEADGRVVASWDKAAVEALIPPPDPTIRGTAAADTLTGTEGDEPILGLDGDDVLHGKGGDDILDGGLGGDALFGGTGDDAYRYRRGDGIDTLTEEGGADVLRLIDLTPADVASVTRAGDDLVLELAGGRATVRDHFKAASALERVEFVGVDGGTLAAWDKATLEAKVPAPPPPPPPPPPVVTGKTITGTDGDDRYARKLVGTEGDDTIFGLRGRDEMEGAGGADRLFGDLADDVLIGGAGADTAEGGDGLDRLRGGQGDDRLRGGAKSDLYLFRAGDGRDHVHEGSGDLDVLRFEDLRRDGLSLDRVGGDLVLTTEAGDGVVVHDQFRLRGAAVERIEFADGLIWDRAQFEAAAQL